MRHIIIAVLILVGASASLSAHKLDEPKKNFDDLKYTISLSRFSPDLVDATRVMYRKAKEDFDCLVQRVGIGATTTIISSIALLVYLNSGNKSTGGSVTAPVKRHEQQSAEKPHQIFLKQLAGGLGMGLGFPLAGLFLYGVVFPASKQINKIVTKYINLLMSGYGHWYISARNTMLRATHELHEALSRTRMHYSHEHPGDSTAREERIDMYDRSNIVNLYNHFLRNYTRVVALMDIRLAFGSQGLMADRCAEVGSMVNTFAKSLEDDLNRFEHGLMPYFSRRTLQLFTIVREQVQMLIHEFNGGLDASREQLLWGEEAYESTYSTDDYSSSE